MLASLPDAGRGGGLVGPMLGMAVASLRAGGFVARCWAGGGFDARCWARRWRHCLTSFIVMARVEGNWRNVGESHNDSQTTLYEEN